MQNFLIQRINLFQFNKLNKFLALNISFLFATSANRSGPTAYNKNAKADSILKNYFNKRS